MTAWLATYGTHLETAARREEAEVDEAGGGEPEGKAEDEADEAAQESHRRPRTRMEVTIEPAPASACRQRIAGQEARSSLSSETSNGAQGERGFPRLTGVEERKESGML